MAGFFFDLRLLWALQALTLVSIFVGPTSPNFGKNTVKSVEKETSALISYQILHSYLLWWQYLIILACFNKNPVWTTLSCPESPLSLLFPLSNFPSTDPTLLLGYKSSLFCVFGVDPSLSPLLKKPVLKFLESNIPCHLLTRVRTIFSLTEGVWTFTV